MGRDHETLGLIGHIRHPFGAPPELVFWGGSLLGGKDDNHRGSPIQRSSSHCC
jgi:hypothetical protein